MRKPTFEQALEQILKEDRRYHEHAYEFLREGLDFTMKALAKPAEGEARHVSGQELLQGLQEGMCLRRQLHKLSQDLSKGTGLCLRWLADMAGRSGW